jgi:NAD(P)H dehydrogenase (quinone)
MIVVTAAAGKLGRATAAALRGRLPLAQFRLAVRDPAKLSDLAAQGFQIVRGDYDDVASLEAAFSGATAVLLISSPELETETRRRQHGAAIAAATRAAARIVYTSFTNASADSRFLGAAAHAETEAMLRAGSAPFTLLRTNQYVANLDGVLGPARASGALAMPVIGAKVAWLAHRDAGEAAAAVLTGGGHEGRCYELTGPEALDGHAVAAVLADVVGRPVVAQDVGLEDFRAAFRGYGMAERTIDYLISLYEASAAGEYAAVSGDLARLTGRTPTTLREALGQER